MSINYTTYFGTTAQSIKTEHFNLSLTLHPPNSIIEKHSHEKPYLCLLTSGNYREESYKSTMIKNGSAIFRTAHYEHANQFSNEQGICLNLEIDSPSDLLIQHDLRLPKIEFEQKGSIDLYRLLYAFKNEVSTDVLNIYCYESLTAHFNMLPIQGKLNWINQVKDYINDDPFSILSLNKLSQEFHLHPNYIIRKFKEVTGFKLSEYLTKVRLEHATRSLTQTDEKMTEIALNSGFYDQSHFNKKFKKFFHTTPRKFKKTVKG